MNDSANEEWIKQELKGYSNEDEVPEYRDLTGRPIVRNHYTGWQYVDTQNLSPAQAKAVSSFLFRAPIAEYESNARQEFVAVTYDEAAERTLIKAIGGGPAIPAVQFTGNQFQRMLDAVRTKVLEWSRTLPEPIEEREAEVNRPPQPAYHPQGLRGFLKENRSWIFQGVGTEVLKGAGVLALMVGSFLVGTYFSQQPQQSGASRESIEKKIYEREGQHAKIHSGITQQIEASRRNRNEATIDQLNKELEREDLSYANDLKTMALLCAAH